MLTLSEPAPLNVQDVLINIAVAAVLSMLLGWHYKRFGTTFSNRAKLAWILPAVALPTVLVISVVKASLALSLGLVGALSIVRFRTPVKEPEELTYIFLAIAVGLGLGADQRLVTVAAILLILIILTLRALFAGGSKYPNLYMNIQLATLAAKETILTKILGLITPHASTVELRRFDIDGTTLEGTFYLDCKEVDSLMKVQAGISEEFPDATVTFVEQSGVPGA
jgi:hypothetical protein